jgi:hypothetical protein
MSADEPKEREFGRFGILLAALVLFLVAIPFTGSEGAGRWILRIGSSFVLVASVYAASNNRWHLGIAIALAVPALGSQTEVDWFGDRSAMLMRMSLGAALLFYIATLVLLALVKQHRISIDTILGGINVYLLFAIGFAYLHGLVEFSQAGSYQQQGESLTVVFGRDHGGEGLNTFFYFSVITLTTLGYGDISPLSPIARTLCSVEAVVGQLYVAIFIARLVALQASGGGRSG